MHFHRHHRTSSLSHSLTAAEHKYATNDRDVLGSVSLVRQIDTANDLHRAHLDILSELSLSNMLEWIGQNNKPSDFDGLLEAWLNKLDTQELNKTLLQRTVRIGSNVR